MLSSCCGSLHYIQLSRCPLSVYLTQPQTTLLPCSHSVRHNHRLQQQLHSSPHPPKRAYVLIFSEPEDDWYHHCEVRPSSSLLEINSLCVSMCTSHRRCALLGCSILSIMIGFFLYTICCHCFHRDLVYVNVFTVYTLRYTLLVLYSVVLVLNNTFLILGGKTCEWGDVSKGVTSLQGKWLPEQGTDELKKCWVCWEENVDRERGWSSQEWVSRDKGGEGRSGRNDQECEWRSGMERHRARCIKERETETGGLGCGVTEVMLQLPINICRSSSLYSHHNL